jgi:hypothetical protein
VNGDDDFFKDINSERSSRYRSFGSRGWRVTCGSKFYLKRESVIS